jgi:hypothetical protein
MARLHVKTPGLNLSTLDLRLGVNRVGRGPDNDFQLDHPTISTRHCELIVADDGVVLHDCGSTNGSFVNRQPVREIWLEAGHEVRFGDVELLVESTEVHIAIPKIEREIAKPPVVLPDGSMICPRHPDNLATFKCPHCHAIMCSGCVRMLRIKGGKPLFLCCVCHQKCERISGEPPKKKKGLFDFLRKTVLMKFTHPREPEK